MQATVIFFHHKKGLGILTVNRRQCILYHQNRGRTFHVSRVIFGGNLSLKGWILLQTHKNKFTPRPIPSTLRCGFTFLQNSSTHKISGLSQKLCTLGCIDIISIWMMEMWGPEIPKEAHEPLWENLAPELWPATVSTMSEKNIFVTNSKIRVILSFIKW